MVKILNENSKACRNMTIPMDWYELSEVISRKLRRRG